MIHFIKFCSLLLCLTLSNQAFSQLRSRTTPTELDIAKRIVQDAFTDTFNVIRADRIILKNKYVVMLLAERILFDIYGEKNIIDQRPYKIYFINKYWVMWGTGQGGTGGPFEIVIDPVNCRIVRISHGA